jgi:hypothetical protein
MVPKWDVPHNQVASVITKVEMSAVNALLEL